MPRLNEKDYADDAQKVSDEYAYCFDITPKEIDGADEGGIMQGEVAVFNLSIEDEVPSVHGNHFNFHRTRDMAQVLEAGDNLTIHVDGYEIQCVVRNTPSRERKLPKGDLHG
jgi:hypothetical protein